MEVRHRGGRHPRLAVVEYEDDIADLVQTWLAQHGLETVPIGSGAGSWREMSAPDRAGAQNQFDTTRQQPRGASSAPNYEEPAGWVNARGRRRAHQSADDLIRVGPVAIDPSRRSVQVNGIEVHLTPTEFRLLRHLAENPDRLVGHRELLVTVWGHGYEADIHLLQVTMRSLRARIALVTDQPITETVYGAGYRMACPDERSKPDLEHASWTGRVPNQRRR